MEEKKVLCRGRETGQSRVKKPPPDLVRSLFGGYNKGSIPTLEILQPHGLAMPYDTPPMAPP